MLKLDLHVHSFRSIDSVIYPNKKIVKILKKKGIHGLSITDHNLFQENDKFKSLMYKNNLHYIPGIEIQTKNPKMGELLCYFIQDRKAFKSYNFFEITDEVREQDGIAVLSHPFSIARDNWLKNKSVFLDQSYLRNFDGLEGINARNLILSSNRYSIDTARYLKKL